MKLGAVVMVWKWSSWFFVFIFGGGFSPQQGRYKLCSRTALLGGERERRHEQESAVMGGMGPGCAALICYQRVLSES